MQADKVVLKTQAAATKRLARVTGHLVPNKVSASDNRNSSPLQDPPDVSNGPETLAKERQRATFDVRTMTHILDGGEEITKKKHEVYRLIEQDPVFLDAGFHDRTREQGNQHI